MAARDSLDLEVATHLATALTTIGHPRSADSINATALDLIELCKGALIDGVSWTPEKQAEHLVHEARVSWVDGWPERGGTAALYSLYRAKFAPRAEHRPFDADATPEQKAAWRAQYGEPDPEFPKQLVSALDKKKQHEAARKGSLWEAIRDTVYSTEGPGRVALQSDRSDPEYEARRKRQDRAFWQQAMDGHKKKRPAELASFRLELEEHGWETLMAFDWTKAGAA